MGQMASGSVVQNELVKLEVLEVFFEEEVPPKMDSRWLKTIDNQNFHQQV